MEKLTVTFNVGGKMFEVNRSLLSKFDDKVVLRAAADMSAKTDGPIFIDRDGERFVYVLDYMRDGKVHLPLSISKGSFLTDLKYYGIDFLDNNVILIGNSASQMDLCSNNHYDRLEDIEEQIVRWTFKKNCRLFAKSCLEEILASRMWKSPKNSFIFKMTNDFIEEQECMDDSFEILEEIFEEYGFVEVGIRNDIYLEVKTY